MLLPVQEERGALVEEKVGGGILCPSRAGPGLVGAAETSIRSSKEEQLQPGRIHVIRCKFKIKSKDPHLGSI